MHASNESNRSCFAKDILGRAYYERPARAVPARGRRHETGQARAVVEGTLRYGFSESVIIPLGILLTACTILYVIPRTAVLGAILLTPTFKGLD